MIEYSFCQSSALLYVSLFNSWRLHLEDSHFCQGLASVCSRPEFAEIPQGLHYGTLEYAPLFVCNHAKVSSPHSSERLSLSTSTSTSCELGLLRFLKGLHDGMLQYAPLSLIFLLFCHFIRLYGCCDPLPCRYHHHRISCQDGFQQLRPAASPEGFIVTRHST